MFAFLIVLLIVAILALIVKIAIIIQGDAEFDFQVDEKEKWQIEKVTVDTVTLSTCLPFVNRGKQDGTLSDVWPRHQLAEEQFDLIKVSSRLYLAAKPRGDDYWEALLVFRGQRGMIKLVVTLAAIQGDIAAVLPSMPDMPIDIIYQVTARSDWYIDKTRLLLTYHDISMAMTEFSGKVD